MHFESILENLFHLFDFQPKVVSDTDEADLARQLEALEEANREVAGDDSEDEYDDEKAASGDEA